MRIIGLSTHAHMCMYVRLENFEVNICVLSFNGITILCTYLVSLGETGVGGERERGQDRLTEREREGGGREGGREIERWTMAKKERREGDLCRSTEVSICLIS